MEKRDEQTGASLGFFRKFHGDKLQLSYQAMADKFGLTKRQASDACKYLEREGYIQLEFRTIHRNGMALNNVLFIGVDPEAIKDLTHSDPVTFERGRVSRLNGGGVTFKRGTNTEINSEITTEKTESNKRLEDQNARRPFSENSGEAKQGGEAEQQHSPGQQKDRKHNTPPTGSGSKSPAAAPRQKWTPAEGIDVDRQGWLRLPATNSASPADKMRLSRAKALATEQMQYWLCEQGIREIELEEDDAGVIWVRHLNDTETATDAFAPTGNLPLRLLRTLAYDQGLISQEEFNSTFEECFWDSWHDTALAA